MNVLKPCPFCGSNSVDAEGWRNSEGITGPACDDCGASAGGVSHSSMENVAAWNTRASEQLERVAEEMAAKLKVLEWAGYDENEAEVCPDCESPESLGRHVSGCGLQKALTIYAKWKEK